MVKKGDSLEDVIKYVEFRVEHLKLERKIQPDIIENKIKIQKAIDKLGAKIEELQRMKKVLNGNIKEYSKKEWRNVFKLNSDNK